MVRSCYICGVTTNISLFGFPKKEAIRKLWMEFCFLNEELVNENSKLCSRHFLENDILKNDDSFQTTNKRTRARLKPDVVPSILRQNTFQRNCELRQRTCLLCGTSRDSRVHFKFPKDIDRRRAWLYRCGYENEPPENVENTYLCEIHFCHDDTLMQRNASGCNRLRPNAIPKLHIPVVPSEENTNKKAVEISINSSTSTSTPPSTSNISSRKRRIAYVGDILSPDLATSKRARRSFQLLKDEVVKCRRKIDIMNKRNRRLITKVTNYKEIIACLKKKLLLYENASLSLTECL